MQMYVYVLHSTNGIGNGTAVASVAPIPIRKNRGDCSNNDKIEKQAKERRGRLNKIKIRS